MLESKKEFFILGFTYTFAFREKNLFRDAKNIYLRDTVAFLKMSFAEFWHKFYI
jgi:hypothetical protein